MIQGDKNMSVFERLLTSEAKLAVVGLGYVGMPLAVSFSKKVKVIGFDTNAFKIEQYINGIDPTMELGNEAISNSTVMFTHNELMLKDASFIIVAVPTPVNDENTPDLTFVKNACEIIGRNLSPGSIISFESTVYPGVTEDICIPLIEKCSGMVCGRDFKIGYSPERINPGDKFHRLDNIVKIVAGMDSETTDEMSKVYELVVSAGIFKAKNIKTAELAKLVENTQRDINIAFMNETAMIFDKFNVNTFDVIEAMNTKWNALNFYPGLVGGHCISVDPYYLIHKAEKEDGRPILSQSSRMVNNGMAAYVADAAVKQMSKANIMIKGSKIYIFGVTYKKNCPDIRNTQVFKIVKRLEEYEALPFIVDPVADKNEVIAAGNVNIINLEDVSDADCIIFTVAHDCFKNIDIKNVNKLFKQNDTQKKVIIDIVNAFEKETTETNGYIYWNL